MKIVCTVLLKITIYISFMFVLGCIVTPLNAQNTKEQYDGQPALSPDGTKIAFISDRHGNNDLWLMDSNGSNLASLTSFTDMDAFFPQWSPDSQKILFLAGKDQTSIYVASILDSTVQNLTPNFAFGAGQAQWSPDGKSIAFTEIESAENSTLWIMDSNGENIRELVTGNHNNFPRWSPNGKSIAYTVTNNSEIQLALTEIETNKTRILSPNNVIEYAWASKSNQIIYTTHNSKGLIYSDIWLVQTDTASEFKLTDEPIPLVMNLAWSPDDKTVLFRSICGNNAGIMMLTLNPKSVINITNCQQGNNVFPTWFADSEHILLQSNRSGKTSIWVMSSDGKEAVDLIGTQ